MKDLQQYVRSIGQKMGQIVSELGEIRSQHEILKRLADRPPSITDEIDRIPGRRIFYNVNAEQLFTLQDNGRRGQPLSFLISQDGPFIMTHYPMAVWRPSAPNGALNLGLWRPVSSYPLPLQASSAGNYDLNEDIVSISWELQDGGSQRNFQNLPTPPILSRPDLMVPLPVPTLFTPNTTIQFIPTFNSIRFSSPAPGTPEAGVLSVALPGYRVVNM